MPRDFQISRRDNGEGGQVAKRHVQPFDCLIKRGIIGLGALLLTLVLLFSFKGDTILANPLTILWIAIPLFIQTNLIFWLGYVLARVLKLKYADAAPAAMIGASNHFEVAIATATMLFGLSSGAALATVVGVLIEVPVMLLLVRICLKTQGWFAPRLPEQRPARA